MISPFRAKDASQKRNIPYSNDEPYRAQAGVLESTSIGFDVYKNALLDGDVGTLNIEGVNAIGGAAWSDFKTNMKGAGFRIAPELWKKAIENKAFRGSGIQESEPYKLEF